MDYYFEERPWGWFRILYETPEYKVKEVGVKPGCRLSYQYHNHRSEHWIVVKGEAKVNLNDQEFILKSNQSADIPVKGKHRIGNEGTAEMVFIEVQRGDYFGEDDIVRLQDDYKRV